MKIVIIDHFGQTPGEKGNNRFVYLAGLLCSRGHSVELVTSTFAHKDKAQRPKSALVKQTPFKMTMISEPGYRDNVSLARLASHRRFGIGLTEHLKHRSRPELIYAAVPSLDAGAACARYCRRTGVPLVIDVQDLWPEAFNLVFDTPVISNAAFAPLRAQASRIYRSADALVAVSETYLAKAALRAKPGIQQKVTYLGTDLQDFDRLSASSKWAKPLGEIWLTYVGTLGYSYDIGVVLSALEILRHRGESRLVFKVLGDGPHTGELIQTARRMNVRADFLGRLPYSGLVGCLAVSDIAMNPIRRGAAQSIINKHADYAAAGLPVVSSQDSTEYRDLLARYGAGLSCPPGDAEGMASAIADILADEAHASEMRFASRRMAEDLFDRRHTYPQLAELVEYVGGS